MVARSRVSPAARPPSTFLTQRWSRGRQRKAGQNLVSVFLEPVTTEVEKEEKKKHGDSQRDITCAHKTKQRNVGRAPTGKEGVEKLIPYTGGTMGE